MKKKNFEKSMEVIRANFRNATHVSGEIVKSAREDIVNIQKNMSIEPEFLYQMQIIIDEYKEFSEAAASVYQQFEDFKTKVETVAQKGEQNA